jgi:hypothetical protein
MRQESRLSAQEAEDDSPLFNILSKHFFNSQLLIFALLVSPHIPLQLPAPNVRVSGRGPLAG